MITNGRTRRPDQTQGRGFDDIPLRFRSATGRSASIHAHITPARGTPSKLIFRMSRLELSGVDLDVANLQLELLRIGSHRKREGVVAMATFAELHDDPRCEQIFEALVGTLRAAKKRQLIDYKGELLLKGISDTVEIELLVPPSEGMVSEASRGACG